MNYESYTGTKRIGAVPMKKSEYCKKYEIEMPETDKDGYEIIDSDGCVSWSPKNSFEKNYRTSGTMNFGHALELMKSGFDVARKGWNGKNMFLFIIDGNYWDFDVKTLLLFGALNASFIAMRTADSSIVPWLASQTDMLAEDWKIVDN